MATRISTAARNAACDAVVDLADAGSGAAKIRVYTGTQPAGPGTAITTETLLAEFTLADPAFGSAASGVATLASTPRATTGVAAGTATWFRMLDSDNVAILDGSAGTSGTELILNTATVSIGVAVSLTSMTVTMPAT
ncbi:hypothetical protein [Streptosporangium sp. NPDC004631]